MHSLSCPALILLAVLAPAASGGSGTGAATPPPSTHSGLYSNRILFQEEIYPYQVLVPDSYSAQAAGPAIVLLHGAGGNGAWSIAAWKDLAEEKGILLIAPTLPFGPQFEPLVPSLLRAIVAEAASKWKPDRNKIYLFGHSAGGILGFDAAMMDSELFAAAAIHAAMIFPSYDWIVGRARRKIPIAFYIGDHDEYFPLPGARRTRDLLVAGGFPLHYVEMPGHDHNYRAVAEQVNRDAWAFLSQYSLTK
jgi:poly(3-hydroxybutyrate) depolymerase